jgi:DNA gyrase subunit A
LVRTRVKEVSVIGRNTQGVRIIRTVEDEHVVALQRIDEIEEEDVPEGTEETSGESIESSETESTSSEVPTDNETLSEGDNE